MQLSYLYSNCPHGISVSQRHWAWGQCLLCLTTSEVSSVEKGIESELAKRTTGSVKRFFSFFFFNEKKGFVRKTQIFHLTLNVAKLVILFSPKTASSIGYIQKTSTFPSGMLWQFFSSSRIDSEEEPYVT